MWRKCRNPVLWICDECGICGGCDACDPVEMYHDGDFALCEDCYGALNKPA